MYGKIFEQMYDGSMVISGWEAIVTMQQLIILADKDGVIDMTPQAISARTTIPLEIINKGLEKLQEPDPDSRTPDEEGRRIVLIDPERRWGWRLVNYKKYIEYISREDKRKKDAERIKEKREKQRLDESRGVSQKSPHIDIDVDVNIAVLKNIGVDLEIWSAYKKHRVKLKAPMTERAETLAIGKLIEFKKSGVDPNKILDQSIEFGWKGLFPLKDEKKQGNGNNGGGKLDRAAEAMRQHNERKQSLPDGQRGNVQDAGTSARILPES